MFVDSWVLDWFAILNIATLAVAVLGLLIDRATRKG